MTDLAVACVLKHGGRYGPKWVERLQRSVERHLPVPHRFVCLTDYSGGTVETIPLEHSFPGWWSKMELYPLPGRVLYLDLDCLIIDDISPLAEYNGERAVLRDFNNPDMIGTAVMAWAPGAMREVWEAFIADPGRVIQSYPTRSDYFTHKVLGGIVDRGSDWLPEDLGALAADVDRIQDLWPGLVGSYRADGLEDGPPEHAVVAFHGDDGPNTVGGWVEDAWKA